MKMPLLKSEFSRNVMTLMTGTTIAQAIPIAISPILTRIYTPEDFGLFALYIGVLMIFSSLVAGKYELSILIPKENKDAQHLVLGSIMLSFVICLCLFVCIVIFVNSLVTLLGNEKVRFWLYFLPLNIFILSVASILYYWNNRLKSYDVLSKGQVIQSVSKAGVNISLGFILKLGSGLIVGTLISSVIYLSYLFRKAFQSLEFSSFDNKKAFFLLKKYKKFPLFMVPSGLLENTASQLPVILMGGSFGSLVVGYYSLSQRMISIPTMLVGAAIGNVFRQEASHHFSRHGECRLLFIMTLKKLILLSCIPFIIFYFFSPYLFAIIFGEEWRVSGEFAQILTPMFFLQFVVSPLSNMFMIAEKQQYDLYMQIYLLLFSGLAFALGYHFKSVEIFLLSYCIFYCFKYLCELFLSYRFSCGY